MDHVTLWMPTLIAHISIDLYKLLQDRTPAPNALCRKSSRVMEMAVDVALVFVI